MLKDCIEIEVKMPCSCANCGAVLRGSLCEYCGTDYGIDGEKEEERVKALYQKKLLEYKEHKEKLYQKQVFSK